MLINFPGSKSITQRLLILTSLASSPSEIINYSTSEDSLVLIDILKSMGIKIVKEKNRLKVFPNELKFPESFVNCMNGGTVLRFISPLILLNEGVLFLNGSTQLKKRPIKGLLDYLEFCNIKIDYLEKKGFLPFKLENRSKIKNSCSVDVNLTSQYLSGLMMVSPKLKNGMKINFNGNMVSKSYMHMTLEIMKQFNIQVELENEFIIVKNSKFSGGKFIVEPDYSGIPYFYIISHFKKFALENNIFNHNSIQGDFVFFEIFRKILDEKIRKIDLSSTPDLLPPIVISSILAGGKTIVYGISHTKLKESDRVNVLINELQKLHVNIYEDNDRLIIENEKNMDFNKNIHLDPLADHRMAMAFGVLKMFYPKIKIKNKNCVSKSFPGFFKELEKCK
jgi:3-phosphoshikimate 1-carboxyvinyltransferase